MSRRIPKADKTTAKSNNIRPESVPAEDKVTFSFAALERTKHFNLDATCQNWASELFNVLKNVSTLSKTDLIIGKYRTYRVHMHEGATPPDPLPPGVVLKDLYQIRLFKSKGGIHGVFNDNVFYVIWFDPLHNMYPDDKYGGLKVITPPKTCCMDREEIIKDLQQKVDVLKEERDFWEKEAEAANARIADKLQTTEE